MKKAAVLLVLLLSSTLSWADDGNTFNIVWGDLFPSCSSGSEDYNMVRCGCEFMVPNFHLSAIGNMLAKSIRAFFLVDSIASFIDKMVSNPEDFVNGILHAFSLQGDLFGDMVGGVTDYVFAVLTPFIVILGLLFIEFIKTYLLLAIPFLLWSTLFEKLSFTVGMVNLAAVVVVFMLLGTIYLLGSDIGIYRPLVVWG